MVKRFLRIRKVQLGLVIFGFFTIVAIFGQAFSVHVLGYTPFAVDGDSLGAPPSSEHWMGTTSSGQDVLSWVIYGTRSSMIVGGLSALIGTGIALVVGLTAGYFGGWVDRFMNGLMLVFGTIPAFAVLFIVAAMVPRANLFVVSLVIGLFEWSGGARTIRAQALSLRDREFTSSLRSIGESTWRILLVESVPHLFSILSPMVVRLIAAGIGMQAAVAFIGLGDANIPSWGLMMQYTNQQNALFLGQWWWFLPPGLCIAFIGLAATLVNFGLDEVTNPTLSAARTRRLARYRTFLKTHPKTPEAVVGHSDRFEGMRR